MVARAARGNPWVFSKNATYSMQNCIDTAKRHVLEYEKYNQKGLSHMRKHCMWYVHGLPGATIARSQFSSCKTKEDYFHVLDNLNISL